MKRTIFLAAWVFIWGLSGAFAESRVALVIGNSAYTHAGVLANPANDASDIADRLQGLGFEVVRGIDLTVNDFNDLLRTFADKVKNADVALLFYAGHGVAVGGINYLVPVDAKLEQASSLGVEAVSLRKIQALMENRPRTNLLFFDACRNNPFTRKLSRGFKPVRAGWAAVSPAKGTYIAFATKPGDVAGDGDGRNSPFTTALLNNISAPNLDVELMMRPVRREVIAATSGDQVPWSRSSMTASFKFGASSARSGPPQLTVTANKQSFAKGDKIRLFITPQKDCRLTLLNVDKQGKSCLLFPHPKLPDTVLKAGQKFTFPPRGALRLDQPGEESFIAMCNASPEARNSAARNTSRINCSKGGGDRNFNNQVFETVTFDLDDNSAPQGKKRQTVMRQTLSVTVADK